MAKRNAGLTQVVNFVAWVTGVIISLTVAFALINGTLDLLPYIPSIVTVIAGWIAILTTLLGVVLAIIDALSK